MRRIAVPTVVLALVAVLALVVGELGGRQRDVRDGPESPDGAKVTAVNATTLAVSGRASDEAPSALPRRALWVLVEDAGDGQPIAGATVVADLRDGSTARATTQPNGLARLEDLAAPVAQLAASAAGYAPDTPRSMRTFEEPVARVVIELSQARSRPIRVVELETGLPVAGARLIIHPASMVRMNRSPFHLHGAIEAGTTDGQGRATLLLRDGGARWKGFVLAVHAAGRRSTWWRVDEDEDAASPWILRIPLGGVLSGTARDAHGEPLSGAMITAFPGTTGYAARHEATDAWPMHDSLHSTGQVDHSDAWLVPLTARSGADGSYRIAGIGLGQPYLVSARKAGCAPVDVAGLRAGDDEDVLRWDPVLAVGGRLVVRVVDPDGMPVVGVYGSAKCKTHWRNLGGGRTDERGVLAFEGLATGTYNVGLQPEPGPETPQNQFGQARYDNKKGWGLSVHEGKTTEVVLVMPRGAHGDPPTKARNTSYVQVSGVVVGADGHALPDIVLRDRGGAPLALTDEEGAFSASVDPNFGLGLGARGPYASTELFVPPSDGSSLRIVARDRQVPVRLRILCPEGVSPPASVSVTFAPGWAGGGHAMNVLRATVEMPWPPDAREAAVERSIQPGGEARLSGRARGFRALHRKIAVAEGVPVHETWLLDRGEVARGRVTGDDGRPIPGARVVVSVRDTEERPHVHARGRTDTEGRFEVGGLPARPWRYQVEAEGYLPLRSSLFDDLDLEQLIDPDRIVLVRAGRIRVVVEDADGLRRAGISVVLERVDLERLESGENMSPDDRVWGSTDLDGTAEFVVRPGDWEVQLPSGWRGVPDLAQSKFVTVAAGERGEVHLRLSE